MSAPLPKHIAYLKREGVTRDGADGLECSTLNPTLRTSAPFAARCEDDRHHFRFIVSPGEMLANWKTFQASRAS